jgi:predicted SprT family Zn-dependent metalloprotease
MLLPTVSQCHIAVWVFDGKDAAPHGKEFKHYARKVMALRQDIEVTVRFLSSSLLRSLGPI